jgi:hypothetical protein
VSPELQIFGIFHDIFGGANLPKLLRAVSTANIPGHSTATKLRETAAELKNIYEQIPHMAADFPTELPQAHATQQVEMWEAPKAQARRGGTPPSPQTVFAISKQLCYARPGWQKDSNSHRGVETSEKMVHTLDEMINGAPFTGLLKYIFRYESPGNRALQLLHFRGKSRDFLKKLNEFCNLQFQGVRLRA